MTMWPPFGRGTRNYGGDELPVKHRENPEVGYRSWLVQPSISGLILHSLHVEYVWEETSEAYCRLTTHRETAPVPDVNCRCGLYAQLPNHALDEWEHMTRGRVHASGTIAMSGRIIKCEAGYKAARATIQSPVIIDVECSGFHTCDAEVTRIQLAETRPLFFGLCDTHAQEVEEPTVDAEYWMEEACRMLTFRYPGLEFLTFYSLKGESDG